MIAANYTIFGRDYIYPPDPTRDILAYYPFDVSANDAFNPAHNGTATNIEYLPGKIGHAAGFNGVNSKIIIPASSDFQFSDEIGDKPFSISFIVNNFTKEFQWWINKRNNTFLGDNFQIIFYAGNIYANLFSFNAAYMTAITDSVEFTTGTFTRITFTYDGSATFGGIKMYKNGEELPLIDASVGYYYRMAVSPEVPITIGKAGWLNDFYMAGVMDDLCVWNRELSPEEVLINAERTTNLI